jgi:hypothetical protein
MKKISGSISYNGQIFQYQVAIRKNSKSDEQYVILKIIGPDASILQECTQPEELLELVKANAKLRRWCVTEGWQFYPASGVATGLARCTDGYIHRIRRVDAIEPPETMSEPVVVEVLDWAEELVAEPVFYKDGIDQYLGSGKYEAFVPYEEAESVLKAGVLYVGENGMIVCRKCAGVRESSGYLSSGESVVPVSRADAAAYRKLFGEDVRCEKGCTGYRV